MKSWTSHIGFRGGFLGVVALSSTITQAAVIHVPADYATIQAAINAAAVGDTVLVAPGNYPENLALNKRLTLRGSGSGSNVLTDTIITSAAASTPVILVTAGGVDAATRLVIRDLRVTGATVDTGNLGSGIFLSTGFTGFATIENVAAVSNSGNGISLDPGAVSIQDVEVERSLMTLNGNAGLLVASTVSLDGLKIIRSRLDANSAGLSASAVAMTHWSLISSSFSDNVGPNAPLTGGYGASFSGSPVAVQTLSDLVIRESEFNGNRGTHATLNISAGLQIVSGAGDNFNHVSIERSTFSRNSLRGIDLETAATGIVSDISVRCSDFERNLESGFLSQDTGTPLNVVIRRSNFVRNVLFGVNVVSAGVIDARENWWNSPSGPTNATWNPGGQGDAISNGVQFAPFLRSSSECAPAIPKEFAFSCDLDLRTKDGFGCIASGRTLVDGPDGQNSSLFVTCDNGLVINDATAFQRQRDHFLRIAGRDHSKEASLLVKDFTSSPGLYLASLELELHDWGRASVGGTCNFTEIAVPAPPVAQSR